jgi:hypothetical protein
MTAPKTVKRPQDRKPKEEKPKVTEMKVMVGEREVDGWEVTLDGVTLHVPKEALDDFELLDELGRIQSGKQASSANLPSILRRLVGVEYTKVLDALRDKESGRVPVEPAVRFTINIFKALNPNG